MNKKDINYKVYLVTDRGVLQGRDLNDSVEKSIQGGAGIIQLREKNVSSLEFYNIAMSLKEITDKYKIPLIINDRLDIALAINADGVHLGQDDLPCKVVRKILGEDKIIGVSVHNLDEAKKAEKDGADYIGCGAVFSTSTKKNTTNIKIRDIKNIKNNINIPMVAIGGINEENICKLEGTGINGVAVVSAILGKSDIKTATQKLMRISL